jgi:hypothetical protein
MFSVESCIDLRMIQNPDRLQMLVTLKSPLTHLQFSSSHFQLVLSNLQTEEYSSPALQQILQYVICSINASLPGISYISIHLPITSDSVTSLVELQGGAYRWNRQAWWIFSLTDH